MAYAANSELYKSLDALELAVKLDDTDYYAQLKYGELLYRLRVLGPAEEETLKALELAADGHEFNAARRQLARVRRLRGNRAMPGDFAGPLRAPALMLLTVLAVVTWTFLHSS